MRNFKLKLLTVAVLLPGFLFTIQAQKSVDLKYNVKNGDQYDYVMDLDQDIIFEANGQQMALDQIMTMKLLMSVNNIPSDSLKINSMVKSVKMTQGIFGMTITYDSDDPASVQNPMAAKVGEEFARMIDKPFYITMDHKGNIGNMDLKGITDNDEVANNLNSGAQFAAYPDAKVSVGDTWEKEIYANESSDKKFHAKYTLLKLSGKQATIDIDGTITANSTDEMDLKMNGSLKGEMVVDVKTGWLIESKINQELELDIEQNGQKFPATISGSIVTTSVKLN
jgi:hypothetical protein